MAISVYKQHGYKCEFIDPVSDDFYCKECSLVARSLTFTSCCGESYCQACIADTQEQAKPCPECGEENFTTLHLIKFQQRLGGLQVYCSMKKRGCSWSGTLEQLDAHLDLDQDNCQYLYISCPLECDQSILKNKLKHHVAEECIKREYVCQHCAFKGTYEVVVDTHWKECPFFPLLCPNLCGVTYGRGLMEDHITKCPLEEVACEFTGVGCVGKFRREKQEEHNSQNTHKHLTIIAAAAVKMNQQLLQKLKEMEQKFLKLQQEKSSQNEAAQNTFINFFLNRTFGIENFSQEKAKDMESDWMSPAMYSHVCGYKFCIGIDASGYDDENGNTIDVYLWAVPGEYDHQLEWPVQARFNIELLNQQGGENVKSTTTREWGKPVQPFTCIGWFGCIKNGIFQHFLEYSKLESFLRNDTLYFNLSNITIC